MAETPWQKARKRQSVLQEKNFGSGSGANKQLNSGRTWFSKRDTRKFNFLVENRTTEKATTRSYTIKVNELKAMTRDAFFHNLLPAMNIAFPFDLEDWMLIRTVDFEEIYERNLELEAALKHAKID